MMDQVPEHFRPEPKDVIDLIERNPLAWLVADLASALLVPVRPRLNEHGHLVALRGHLPRNSSVAKVIRETGRASILFRGTSGYISPSWLRNRVQAPTWASTSAAFLCHVSLNDNADDLEETLRDLVDALEVGRPNAWKLEEVGSRYECLAQRIIGFTAEIEEERASFRVGQDEDDETFVDILDGLEREGRTSLTSLMRAFRRDADKKLR